MERQVHVGGLRRAVCRAAQPWEPRVRVSHEVPLAGPEWVLDDRRASRRATRREDAALNGGPPKRPECDQVPVVHDPERPRLTRLQRRRESHPELGTLAGAEEGVYRSRLIDHRVDVELCEQVEARPADTGAPRRNAHGRCRGKAQALPDGRLDPIRLDLQGIPIAVGGGYAISEVGGLGELAHGLRLLSVQPAPAEQEDWLPLLRIDFDHQVLAALPFHVRVEEPVCVAVQERGQEGRMGGADAALDEVVDGVANGPVPGWEFVLAPNVSRRSSSATVESANTNATAKTRAWSVESPSMRFICARSTSQGGANDTEPRPMNSAPTVRPATGLRR